MVSGKVIGGAIIAVMVLGAVIFTFATTPQNTVRVIDTPQENVVTMTSNGFSPQTLTISKGESVTFVNEDSRQSWPATDIHPTHTVYPGSDISKCGTSQESEVFDACRGLSQGETYTFTFNEAGTWNYHDHFRPGLTGTIIVE